MEADNQTSIVASFTRLALMELELPSHGRCFSAETPDDIDRRFFVNTKRVRDELCEVEFRVTVEAFR